MTARFEFEIATTRSVAGWEAEVAPTSPVRLMLAEDERRAPCAVERAVRAGVLAASSARSTPVQ
jgi:hypothetical protein